MVAKQQEAVGMPNSNTVELEDAPHSPFGGFREMIGTFKGKGTDVNMVSTSKNVWLTSPLDAMHHASCHNHGT